MEAVAGEVEATWAEREPVMTSSLRMLQKTTPPTKTTTFLSAQSVAALRWSHYHHHCLNCLLHRHLRLLHYHHLLSHQ